MTVCLVDHRIETTAVHATDYVPNLKELKIEDKNNEGQRLLLLDIFWHTGQFLTATCSKLMQKLFYIIVILTLQPSEVAHML